MTVFRRLMIVGLTTLIISVWWNDNEVRTIVVDFTAVQIAIGRLYYKTCISCEN